MVAKFEQKKCIWQCLFLFLIIHNHSAYTTPAQLSDEEAQKTAEDKKIAAQESEERIHMPTEKTQQPIQVATGQQIKDLEKKKDELYKKIQDSIDNNIKSLSNRTDRVAISVLESIKELKQNIQKEGVSSEIDKEIKKMINDTLNSPQVRQKLQSRRQLASPEEIQEKLLHEMRLELYSYKKRGKKGFASKSKFMKIIKKKIDIFLADRDAEHGTIFNETRYRHKLPKCPRYGELRKSHQKELIQYPCCRKCCKQSYMGCF